MVGEIAPTFRTVIGSLPTNAGGGLGMAASQLGEQAIFEVARKIDSRDAREGYLRQICGDDAAIDQRVRTLLKAYEESASFLESPVAAALITADEPVREGSGANIGPYKLLEQIGEGGFGVVFLALQRSFR
jgi:eukaryotic-like serine/threonine-protein kinase